MGANQDLSVVTQQMGLDAGNVTIWTTNSVGTQAAYACMGSSVSNYRGLRAKSLATAVPKTSFYVDPSSLSQTTGTLSTDGSSTDDSSTT